MIQQLTADFGNPLVPQTPGPSQQPPKPIGAQTPAPVSVAKPAPVIADSGVQQPSATPQAAAPTPIASSLPTTVPQPNAALAPTPSPVSVASAASPLTATPAGVPLVGPSSVDANGNTLVDGTLNPTAGDVPPLSYYYGSATPTSGSSSLAPSPVLGGSPATSLAPGVNTTPINPVDDLRSQLITPGPATDRYAIAQQQLQTYNDATQPLYDASMRDAEGHAAAAGQLGSGQLRSSLGNVADQRNLDLATQGQNFLQNALQGSIQDAYNNVGIAQQQQAYQSGAQNQSFNQGLEGATTQQALTNSAVQNALSELAAGSSGSPADMQMLLSQIFSGQAGQAGNALSSMISGTVNNNAQQASTDALMKFISGIYPQGTTGTGS